MVKYNNQRNEKGKLESLYSLPALTNAIEKADKARITGNLEDSLKILKQTFQDIESAKETGYISEQTARNLASTLLKRVYRISDSLDPESNPELDRNAVNLISRLEREYALKPRILEIEKLQQSTAIAASVIGILGGLFLLSPNLTGNAIGNMTNSTSSIIGAVLIVVGVVAGFFYIRKK